MKYTRQRCHVALRRSPEPAAGQAAWYESRCRAWPPPRAASGRGAGKSAQKVSASDRPAMPSPTRSPRRSRSGGGGDLAVIRRPADDPSAHLLLRTRWNAGRIQPQIGQVLQADVRARPSRARPVHYTVSIPGSSRMPESRSPAPDLVDPARRHSADPRRSWMTATSMPLPSSARLLQERREVAAGHPAPTRILRLSRPSRVSSDRGHAATVAPVRSIPGPFVPVALPISPSMSASISNCRTLSATARRKSPSPEPSCRSSFSGSLSSRSSWSSGQCELEQLHALDRLPR